MPPKLKNSLQVWKLASDLGIKSSDNPVSDILRYCDKKIRKVFRDFPDCKSLSNLLQCAASKLGTFFEIPTTDIELEKIKWKYLQKGEKGFATLEQDLSEDVFGITFKRCNREPWEPQFVSVIDCRGEKAARSYYTKWHEISHLLVLTEQTRLSFRRTHCPSTKKDPEEALIEVIAGTFGFYSPITQQHAKGEISFETFEDLRRQLCPEASQQSSLIGFVKAWPKPCLLLCAEMAVRKHEEAKLVQQSFHFQNTPLPVLRAVHVTPNDEARKIGMTIYKNMRIPKSSVIYRVFMDGITYDESEENLSWWESSDGTILPERPVRVKAKGSRDSVDAMIIPIKR
jgi:hypothetical protein